MTITESKGLLPNSSNSYVKLVKQINNPIVEQELLTFPNQPIIWGIISGSNQGQIYELSNGKAVIIIGNFAKPLIFIVGMLDEADFNHALALCPEDAFIYCASQYHKWLVGMGWQILSRVQLTYSNPSPVAIKEGLTIKPIDNLALFQKCCWFEKIGQRYYGNPQNFLTHGQGYALCNDHQILAEVYSAFTGRDHVEIAIITHPDFRNQQYAAMVSSYLAEKIRLVGKIPIWSCTIDNLGSLKTALRIGFEIQRYYIQIVKDK